MATLNLRGNNKWEAASVYDSELEKDQHSINADAEQAAKQGTIFGAVVEDNFRSSGEEMAGTVTASYIAANKEITYYGQAYRCLEVDVTPGQEISVAAWAGWTAWFYCYYDQDGQFISGQQSANAASTTIEADTVVPDGAVKLAIAGYTDSMPTATLVSGYKLITDTTLSVPDMAADAEAVGDALQNISSEQARIEDNFAETWSALQGDVTASYINSSGVITYYGGAYRCLEAAVNPGDKIKLNAFAGYSGYFYAFYNSGGTFISGRQSGSGSGVIITDEVVTVPDGAVKLAVAGNTAAQGTPAAAISMTALRVPVKKWLGKKWACIGDSLTAINSRTTKHYFDYVSDETGITVENLGVSGTGYRNAGGVSRPFYVAAESVPADADVVTIFGSFNDGLTDLGTATDSDLSTVGGCVNHTIDVLQAAIPTIQLGIVSPTPWVGANPYNHPEANAYPELLEAICKRRSIPFLNLYFESSLRPWDAAFRALAYSKDEGNGVHPDETGHKLIAGRFEAFLSSLIV